MGAMLTRWGMWQPSLKHNKKPTVLEALIGGLESTGNQHNVKAIHRVSSYITPYVLRLAIALNALLAFSSYMFPVVHVSAIWHHAMHDSDAKRLSATGDAGYWGRRRLLFTGCSSKRSPVYCN